MGDILAFVQRVRSSGDWTTAERTRLDALADRFAAEGVHVQVVYGATDEGDPWCVVMDENDEILVHVARIDGRFIIHSASDDTLAEGGDLPSALSEQMAHFDAAPPVVPFSQGGRQAQILIALIAATAFFYDTQDAAAAEAPAPDLAGSWQDMTPPPPLGADDVIGRERDTATAVTGAAEPAPAARILVAAEPEPGPTAPASAAAPLPAESESDVPTASGPLANAAPAAVTDAQLATTTLIRGSDNADHLVGAAQAERIEGGGGDDTLEGGGAENGRLDTLDGGAGDDRIQVTSQTIVNGREGADTFVLATPTTANHADTLLGAITDFDAGQGDQLVNFAGVSIGFTPPPVIAGPADAPPAAVQVFVDLNGDGLADGYVKVGGGLASPLEDVAGEGALDDDALDDGALDGGQEQPVVITGHTLDYAGY